MGKVIQTLIIMFVCVIFTNAQNMYIMNNNNIQAEFDVNTEVDSIVFYDDSKVQQDSLYVMKLGNVSSKYEITTVVDSVIFYNPRVGGGVNAVNLKSLYPDSNLIFEENFDTWNPIAGNSWEASSLGSTSSWQVTGGQLKITGNDQSMIGNIKLAEPGQEGTIIYEFGSISGTHTGGEWNIRPRFFVSGGEVGWAEMNHSVVREAAIRTNPTGDGYISDQIKRIVTTDMDPKIRITRFSDGTLSIFSWNSIYYEWEPIIEEVFFDTGRVSLQLFVTKDDSTFSDTREVNIDRVTVWGDENFAGYIPNPKGKNPNNVFNPNLSYKVHLFYYSWYGNPSTDYGWVHWQQAQNVSQLPNSIGADFYPAEGAYSSADSDVIRNHMQLIAQAKIGVIAITWWGQGNRTDQLAQKILDIADEFGVKVAWLMEPYSGRTGQSTADDIKYINEKYGYHPAFFYAADKGDKPVFYVWKTTSVADWSALDQVNQNNIVLAQHTNLSDAMTAHWSGLYNYSVPYTFYDDAGIQKLFTDMSNGCKNKGLIWSNSIIPGYADIRATANDAFLDRDNGNTYTKYWNMAVNSGTEWISITSFNEWHEGTGIEPVNSNPPTPSSGTGYYDFNGAYGKTGVASENAYIDKTAELIGAWPKAFTP